MNMTSVTLSDLLVGDVRARLKDLLSPQATVTISCSGVERLPLSVLAVALEVAATSPGLLRLEGLSAQALNALQLIDPERRLAVDDTTRLAQVGDRPFLVSVYADGRIELVLQRGIGQYAHIRESASYEWIRGIDATSVILDLSQVDHLNSLLVAWLLQFNQGAGPKRCRLVHVGRQSAAQLRQLRLDHVLTLS